MMTGCSRPTVPACNNYFKTHLYHCCVLHLCRFSSLTLSLLPCLTLFRCCVGSVLLVIVLPPAKVPYQLNRIHFFVNRQPERFCRPLNFLLPSLLVTAKMNESIPEAAMQVISHTTPSPCSTNELVMF